MLVLRHARAHACAMSVDRRTTRAGTPFQVNGLDCPDCFPSHHTRTHSRSEVHVTSLVTALALQARNRRLTCWALRTWAAGFSQNGGVGCLWAMLCSAAVLLCGCAAVLTFCAVTSIDVAAAVATAVSTAAVAASSVALLESNSLLRTASC